MSNSQSQQQKKNRKAFSKTLKSQIKRKPHTQPINGIQYTYGLLQKKSQSSLFNNERFLLIKGHQTFGYVSKLSDETLLPLLQESNIPKCKIEIPLQKLQISNEKQVLIVQFVEQGKKDKTRWQFTCGSKVKAIQWRQKLQGAKNQKIAASKNTAFKVILQDPKQNIQESQNERPNQKDPKLQSEKLGNGLLTVIQNEQNKNNNLTLPEEEKNPFIEINKNELNQKTQNKQEQSKALREKQKDFASLLISPVSQQKFPEVNIFQSLLYSSPTKQPSKLFLETQQKTNQKSLSDLKNQQNFSGQMSGQKSKSQLQYQRLKKQQQNLQDQLREENNGLLGSVLNTLADKKYQLQKLKKQWGFQFAKGGNEYDIVESFKIYSQIIVMKIIDELSLQSKKRYYQPLNESTTSHRYEIDGVSFDLYFHTLKEVASYQKKGSIISSYQSKLAQKQFKNYEYILSLTGNKGRIRVPLSIVIEYKGFICVAKVIIPEGESYENLDSLSKQLGLLQAESRVNNSVFENEESGRIVPLNSKAYQKIARLQNSLSPANIAKKFDICYVQSLTNYLPQDFYHFAKLQNLTGSNRGQQLSSLSPVHILRKQLIQDQQYDEIIFSGQNMASVTQRLKIPPLMKDAIDVLINVSKSINERVTAAVNSLQSLNETVTNSKELTKLIHGYGVNMRYLGLVLEKSRETWLRSIIMSEVVARCAKKFLQFDLQNCIINLNESKTQNTQKYLNKVVISLLNKLLGLSLESDQFWNQLSRQSQEDYQCFIDKREVNLGYLVQALQSQCKIKLKKVIQKRDSFFKIHEPLNLQNFESFVVSSKTYDLSFTQLYTTVGQHLKEHTQESFEQLSILLNLQRKSQLPSHFQMNNFNTKIMLYMINWISPKDGRNLYYQNGQMGKISEIFPSKALYETKLNEIKWILKQKEEIQAEKVRDWMVDHIHMWLGQYHPLLSQLYDIFSRFYLSLKREEKKAITYCKSSIKNLQKLLSRDNIKLADSYYMLAEIYINYDKKSEALGSLVRARQIMQQRQGDQQESQGYGMVILRIGQVMLSLQMINQAIQQGQKAYQKLVQSNESQKLVESLQLIGRCFEILSKWDEYLEFVEIFLTNHHEKFVLFGQNSLLLQRVMKAVLLPYLRALTNVAHIPSQLINVIQSFTSLSSTTQSTYSNGVAYLNQLIASSNNIKFPQSFILTLQDDLQVVLQQIDSSGLMARWKGFQTYVNNKTFSQKLNSLNNINPKIFEFLSQLQTLAILLGQSWLIGALNYC